jgi:hypothetical protein
MTPSDSGRRADAIPEPSHTVHGPTILMAWHRCGKVFAALVSHPEWPENADYRAQFEARQAGLGRSISEGPVSTVPRHDEWCTCFSGREVRERGDS